MCRTLRWAACGWPLDHPRIEPLDLADLSCWPTVDVLFLAVDEVSHLWERAVGEGERSFRAVAHETVAWERLIQLLSYLRTVWARGGWLIFRSDLPSSRCRVRCRPEHPRFPLGKTLNAYEALAPAHPVLTAVAQHSGRLLHADLEPVAVNHPLATYVREFEGEFLPEVALRNALGKCPTPLADGTVLAQTSLEEPLAFACERLAFVPPLAGVEPAEEATVLWLATRELHLTPTGE